MASRRTVPALPLDEYQAFNLKGNLVTLDNMSLDDLRNLAATMMDRIEEIEQASQAAHDSITAIIDRYRNEM